jgi:hypothetical protein
MNPLEFLYCRTHLIHNYGKQRLVIKFRQRDPSDSPSFNERSHPVFNYFSRWSLKAALDSNV